MITVTDVRKIAKSADANQFVEARYGRNIKAMLADLDAGLNRLIRSNLKEADTFVESCRPLLRSLPNEYRYKRHAMHGRVCHFSGRFQEARRHYRQALSKCLDSRNADAAAKIRRALIEVYMYVGDYHDGLEAGRKSLRYFQRKGLERDAAQVMTNMGNVYHRMDNNRMALRYYNRARKIFSATGGVPIAIVDYNRANIMSNMNRLTQARDLYLSAAEVYAKEGMRIPETLARYSVAYLHFLDDRYADALRLLEEVRQTFLELGDIRAAAVAQLDLMEIDLQLNQYGSAVMIGEEVVPQFRQLGMRYEQAKALYFSGRAKLALKDLAQAKVQLDKAETLFRQEDNYLWVGMTAIAYSELYQAQGKYAAAVEASANARNLFIKSKDERRRIDADISSLEARLKAGGKGGLLRRAEELLKEGLARYQEYHINSVLGEFYFSDENYTRALGYFRKAVELVELMLTGLQPDEIRFFFTVNKFESYQRLVECLIKLGRIEEALRRNLSALALLNQRTIGDARLAQEVPESLLSTMRSLRLSLNRIQAFPRGGERVAGGSHSYASVEQRLWRQERRLRHYHTDAGPRSSSPPQERLRFREMLADDETLLNFAVTDGRLGAFVVDKSSSRFFPLDISAADLRVLNRKLQFVFENTVSNSRGRSLAGETADAYLRNLYAALIEPIRSKINTSRLIVLGDADLGQVPFAALTDSTGKTLHEVYDVRLIVNPTDLANQRDERIEFKSRHNSVFAVPSSSLPAVGDEGMAISELFASDVFVGKLATGDHLREALQQSSGFVHLAAHASRSSENPLFSRILLGDGPFFPFDLYGTGIRAELITLSGCQTAAPGLNYGNSFSLAKAFYKAGGRYVLASLWPVSDRLTKIFMVNFYTALKESGSVAMSYREAVARLQDRTGLPAYWSAFILLGL